ncbi:hypothetical protein NQ314_000715 [Rhamnusium bicolor]|uniref:Uncharacterized protein n=1 Tax=Rhamnusium bicolor TaxID=1586634 RepID=A0AAV8ZVZ8_9CUCU|nr:hypothetical protein NQ314_000715 [Rhamnusium bicolor]
MESPISKPKHDDTFAENNESSYIKSASNLTSTDDNKEVIEKKYFTSVTTIEITEINTDDKSNADTDDLVILRRDPNTQKNLINKTAYAKLHRTLSPSRNSSSVDNLKEKYETTTKPDLIDVKTDTNEDNKTNQNSKLKRTSPIKLDEETVQSLKNKYSPASFGYPRTASRNSKLPIPKPRGAVKSQIIHPSSKQPEKNKLRYSLNVDKKSNSKDENSNELYRKNSSSSGEFISIVTRSDSDTSKIFGKDKKRKEDEKNKLHHKENVANAENIQNETNAFSRQSTYRHTTGGNSNIKPKESNLTRADSVKYTQQEPYITKEMEDRYAQMHVSQFNHIKQGFEHPTSDPISHPTDYVPMEKPIVKNNPGPTNYMNMPNVRKYIDTSSSASTLESDMSNVYRNDILAAINKEQIFRDDHESINDNLNTFKSIRFGENNKDNSRDTPPRAQELRQDVRLVNPKALIPINSERSLPNPYQNNETSPVQKPLISPKPILTDKTEKNPYFEETYGTVFDSLEYSQGRSRRLQRVPSKTNDVRGIQKPPRSPSFEPTKLKLPPNREIIPLSPRVKSPIPHDNVSTEKIIATELLKPTKSPTPTRKTNTILSSPSHQKLEIDIDYPDNINNERNENTFESSSLSLKPPISKIYTRRSPEGPNSSINSLTKQRISQHSPAFDSKGLNQISPASEDLDYFYSKHRRSQASPVIRNQEKITTNAMVHANSSNTRTPTPNSLLITRSSSPLRPQSARSSTPVDLRISPSSKSSPQKEDMRKSVEAYYWKEIKKLKEQENFDIYLYEMQMMPYGYAEDPISIRRSRSLSPTSHRNSRRSLSLPRDPRPNKVKEVPENSYGRMPPDSIPEGRAVVNQQLPQRNIMYGQLKNYPTNFRRNAPERRTIEVFSSSRDETQSLQSWPTKNGFTQSPPQRRIENNRNSALEDDVFLPNTPRSGNEIYGYTNKMPNVQYSYGPNTNEDIYYTSRQHLAHQKEPLYGPNPNMRYRQTKTVEYGPQDEYLYGQPRDAVSAPYALTRHGSIQIQEPLYGQRQAIHRRMSYDNASLNSSGQRRAPEPQYVNKQQIPPQNQVDPRFGYKREIIMKDEIFGQFGGYVLQNNNEARYLQNKQLLNPNHSSKQSVVEPIYGRGGPKQVSVRNKVCDIYGQIHDRDSPSLTSPGQIRKSGVILGQLQSNPGSPEVVRQSYSHLSNEQFARNTRLTASANDMYRRYPNTDPRYRSDVVYGGVRYVYQEAGAPTRPLPPVPKDKKVLLQNNSGKSDTESASDASEMQRVLKSSAKNKKRSFFGK